MGDDPGGTNFSGLTDIHAHPAMNAFLWDRDLRRHYWSGRTFNPLSSLTDFKMLRKGGVKVLWSSLHVPEPQYMQCPPINLLAHFTGGGRKLLRLSSWQCLLVEMNRMEDQVANVEGEFEVATSNADLDRILAAGRTAIVHTVEGGHVLGAGLADDDLDGRLRRLARLSKRGVASITIAHLFPNDLAEHADGIPANRKRVLFFWRLDPEVDETAGLGLTPTGAAVIERMIELRMVPDLTHSAPKARQEILELVGGRTPVVATHVGVRSLNPVPYNLTEPEVRAIADSGGVVGVIFMPYWLDEADPRFGREAIWATMERLYEWSGASWRHVAIGTDFDGFTDPADDFNSEAKLAGFKAVLESEGLAPGDVNAILGGNARRVLRDGWI